MKEIGANTRKRDVRRLGLGLSRVLSFHDVIILCYDMGTLAILLYHT